MSLAPHIKIQLHQAQEAKEAAEPYDQAVATRVVIKKAPEPDQQRRAAVWDKNPWDRFDRKTVLAYTGNQDRIALLQREYSRVGLNDVHVHWNTPNKMVEDLFATKTQKTFLGRPYKFSIFNNAFGHYSIIKEAYELGCEHCLIMEDDIRFLRDVERIKEILDDIPKDYACALLDSHPLHEQQLTGERLGSQVSEFWRICPERTSAACYALSSDGMERMIELYESDILCSSDMYFKEELFGKRIYYADPCIARQVRVTSAATNSAYDIWSDLYNHIGCPRKNYGK